MKKRLNKITDLLADAALLEMGVNADTPIVKVAMVHETLEENLIEVTFGEVADYDDIHEAFLREIQSGRDIKPDDCQYNDICFT